MHKKWIVNIVFGERDNGLKDNWQIFRHQRVYLVQKNFDQIFTRKFLIDDWNYWLFSMNWYCDLWFVIWKKNIFNYSVGECVRIEFSHTFNARIEHNLRWPSSDGRRIFDDVSSRRNEQQSQQWWIRIGCFCEQQFRWAFWAFGKYLILINKTPPEILWSCMAFTMHVLVMFVQKLRYITINFIITQSIVNWLSVNVYFRT